jgi:hypothetical protein
MAVATQQTVVGVFSNPSDAQDAICELKNRGVPEAEIGMILRESSAADGEPADAETMMAEGAAAGAVTGAGIGALWALGIAANIVPGIGPVISGGLLTAILASAAGGAAVAGLFGALLGLGLSEEEARYYEREVISGRTLVTVRHPDDPAEVDAIMHRHGGVHLHESAPPQ